VLAALLLVVGPRVRELVPVGDAPAGGSAAGAPVRAQATTHSLMPIVQVATPARTPRLSSLPFAKTAAPVAPELEPTTSSAPPHRTPDAALQRSQTTTATPPPLMSFEGMAGNGGPVPPDVEGDIGPNDYLEWVNIAWTVYDRSGNALIGPIPGNTPSQSLPNPNDLCRTTNSGDPMVLYDQLANRWVLSQFAYSLPRTGPYYECIAVSTSGDPTGSYCAYSFQVSANVWNDYGKIALWPDAYYFSFSGVPNSGTPEQEPVAWAVDRQQLLACNPAQAVYFDPSNNAALAGVTNTMLPADLDGSTPPPAGSPDPYLMSIDGSPDHLSLFHFHVDWANPLNSTFTKKADLNVPAFDSSFTCNTPVETRQCIPQKDIANKLDVLAQRLMKRLTYRRFADHESLVANETVDVGADQAGIRWYELRDPLGSPTVYQASTFSPDANNRWLGSAAMDKRGDLAIGYDVSSSTMYPSLRYAGRTATTPPGQLDDEATMFNGTGSQPSHGRWGDYQSLSIDPVDDCTFWFAGEYYATTTYNLWHTRIGTFRFPSCNAPTAALIRSFTARHGVIRWSTASEVGIAGFAVYRVDGTRVNARLIRGRWTGTPRGGTYRLVDPVGARTYRLRIVRTDGTRSWYQP
jgi:hypothetical protein